MQSSLLPATSMPATTAHGFLKLPLELRREIWNLSFEPRYISLFWASLNLQSRHEYFVKRLPFVYLLPGAQNVCYLTASSCDPPKALSVHHESRQFALRKYQHWRMFNCTLHIRDFVWDPVNDVVNLAGPPLSMRVDKFFPIQDLARLVELFERQFPREIKKMERLSVSSHFWADDELKNHRLEQPERALIKCPKLKEFIVLLDMKYEWECLRGLRRNIFYLMSPDVYVWSVPEDIEKSIDSIRSLLRKKGVENSSVGMSPRVRVVMDKSRIFGEENLSIRLRCSFYQLDDIYKKGSLPLEMVAPPKPLPMLQY
jgi:hypothetical protein